MRILKNIWKNETVCCIAFFLAVFSAFLVTPDGEYLAYPDYRTIALLFCLMIIVAGFRPKASLPEWAISFCAGPGVSGRCPQ